VEEEIRGSQAPAPTRRVRRSCRPSSTGATSWGRWVRDPTRRRPLWRLGDAVPYKMHMVISPILPSSWLGRKQLSLAGEQPARPVRWARTSQASDSISCSCALPFFASRWSQHWVEICCLLLLACDGAGLSFVYYYIPFPFPSL
jgi:hypothetical protein